MRILFHTVCTFGHRLRVSLAPVGTRAMMLALLATSLLGACRVKPFDSEAKPIAHNTWDSLLQKHVDAQGFVDYKGFIADSNQLNTYLTLLQNHHPNDKHWDRNEQMAFWINAYNAFTVKLIVDNYPTASIKDIKNGIPFINTVWDIKFIKIEGATYDLNNIEHGILRPKFGDARIHFAVNCAAYSCPTLKPFAYTAAKLDAQLDQAARDFLSDTLRNQVDSPESIKLSKIFSWYSGDFRKDGADIITYINRYAPIQVNKDAKVEYLDYLWSLNDQALR